MAAINCRQPDLTVVLVDIEDPRNIAAVMRTCDAVGVQEIFVLNRIEPRVRNWKFRSGRSAEKWISLRTFSDADACFSAVQESFSNIVGATLSGQSTDLYQTSFIEPTALVFGNERHGLSNDILQYCTGTVLIPQVGIIKSLNISVACAVCLYEAFRQKSAAGHYAKQKLPTEKKQALMRAWNLDFGT